MNIFERRKLSLFLTCLLLAVIGWLFFAFSNRYEYKAVTAVKFINSPPEKAFHPLQSDTVTLRVEGSGWQLLFSKLRIFPRSIEVDLKTLDSRNFVTFSGQLNAINRQVSTNQRIVAVSPDTLYFDFSERSVKKVPVKLAYKFGYQERYGISGPPEITPAYVTVMGPAADIANINFWITDSLTRSNLKGPITAKVLLKHSDKNNVSIIPSAVDVRIAVDEFTEKSIDIPLRISNNNGYDVKLLPEKVKVTFLTALGNYNKSDRERIKASVDLSKWENNGYKQLPVNLSDFPPYYHLVRIDPQIVDFIIQ